MSKTWIMPSKGSDFRNDHSWCLRCISVWCFVLSTPAFPQIRILRQREVKYLANKYILESGFWTQELDPGVLLPSLFKHNVFSSNSMWVQQRKRIGVVLKALSFAGVIGKLVLPGQWFFQLHAQITSKIIWKTIHLLY